MYNLRLDNNLYINYKQQKYGNSNSPTILFIHGLMSDINGYKCEKIDEFCKLKKLNFVAFDNLGHGKSDGRLEEHNITSWLNTAKEVIQKLELKNIILVGSSKGGLISLLLCQRLEEYISGQVLLAPAPDFTEYIYNNLPQHYKDKLNQNSVIYIRQTEDFKGIPISKQLIEDGKAYILLNKEKININIPTIFIHGMADEYVSYKQSIILNDKIIAPFKSCKILQYSGHRLSSKADLKHIFESIEEIIHFNNQALELNS